MENIKHYLSDNLDVLMDVVKELNSWNGTFESLDVRENDEDFFNTFFEGNVMGAVRAASYGEYNYTDKYVLFDGYGNLKSMAEWQYHQKLEDNIDDIVDVLLDEYPNITIWDNNLKELIEEYEEANEE